MPVEEELVVELLLVEEVEELEDAGGDGGGVGGAGGGGGSVTKSPKLEFEVKKPSFRKTTI